MFGVVLWSDPEQHRAVIWCEDHGDLAFLNNEAGAGGVVELEPGDLVRFDLVEGRHIRRATNPVLVAAEEYPTLARDLQGAKGLTADNSPKRPTAQKPVKNRKIVAFERQAGTAEKPAKRRAKTTRRRQGMSGTG